jgi:hypothetical protein
MQIIEGIHFPQPVLDHLNAIAPTWAQTLIDRAWMAYITMEKALNHAVERNEVKTLLDIGADAGMIDILLGATSQFPQLTDIYLLDGDGTSTRLTEKYSAEQVAWNNVHMGVELVKANVSSTIAVHAVKPDPSLILPQAMDVIISLKSWGHHYPVEVYLEFVKHNLAATGVVLLDIRENTNGRQVLEANGFKVVELIPDRSSKCQRMLLRRN